MRYLEWNDTLAAHFFSQERCARGVQLFATQELIEKIGQPTGSRFQDFVDAVKIGPPWVHRSGICQRALESFVGWRARNLEYPPYLAFLALFVVAAGLEDESPAYAYYPRLRKILGEDPHGGGVPSFDKMLKLWDDIEQWSNVDKDGEFGVFKTRLLGSLIHVGVPRAQTLLSEEELHSLPQIFAKAGLDPTSPPSEQEISQIVLTEGKYLLSTRTVRTLKSSAETDLELRRALVDLIVDELREWSGEIFDTEDEGGLKTHLSGSLRLCSVVDRTAATIRTNFRCRMSGEFPEEGLVLRAIEGRLANLGKDSVVTCDEWGGGWSSPLEFSASVVNAGECDWENPIRLDAADGELAFRFPGSAVRILVEGASEGLPGLVEVRRLPYHSKFYLFVKQRHVERLASWGARSCDGWAELHLRGLPAGWQAFVANQARNDEGIREDYPALAMPTDISLSLEGGIRVARGNRYFDFALPSVTVTGAGIDQVLLNEVVAGPPNEAGHFGIPENLPLMPDASPDRILIEARKEQHTLARLTIYVCRGGWSWTSIQETLAVGTFGQVVSTAPDTPTVRGACTSELSAPDFDFASAVPLEAKGSIHYIGREPGQVIHWPAEEMPEEWSPIWVIVARRRGEVIFCGSNPDGAQPLSTKCSDRKKLRMWQELLWRRRKLLRPPIHSNLRSLWQLYTEAARDA